jgi:hypothetical protein
VTARGFSPEACAFDKGYDHRANYDGCEERGIRPIIPMKNQAKTPPGPPTCEHGVWTFAGADFKRGASKWRCPSGECKPASNGSRRAVIILSFLAGQSASVSFTWPCCRRARIRALEERVRTDAASRSRH